MQSSSTDDTMNQEKPQGPGQSWTRYEWLSIGLLTLFALSLRLWHLTHTEVAARDSIGFIRIAWQFKQSPVSSWPDVLRKSHQHPGYPLAITAMSVPVYAISDAPDPYRMQWSAQLVSAVASILLVIPMFLLGRELFDCRIGFAAALIAQCLPVGGRVFSDGLSEGLFLLFATSALLWAVRGLRAQRSPKAFALTGFFAALAYLTRPEGMLIVAVTGFVLLLWQWRTWRRFLLHGTSLVVPAVLVAMPFVMVTGQITVKPTGKLLLKNEAALLEEPERNTGPLLFAAWWHGDKDPSQRSLWAVYVLLAEMIEASFYMGWLPTLLAWWWFRGQVRQSPGAWVLLLLALGISLALWRVAILAGYLSSRHTVLICMCCIFWTAAGLLRINELIAARMGYPIKPGSVWALVLPLLFCASALPKTLQPLHKNRAGFRTAGEWLAQASHPIDRVNDPFCWTHYFAGRVFLEGTSTPIPPKHVVREYIVLDRANNPHRRLSHLSEIEQRVRASNKKPLYIWSGYRRGKKAQVHIYAFDLQ